MTQPTYPPVHESVAFINLLAERNALLDDYASLRAQRDELLAALRDIMVMADAAMSVAATRRRGCTEVWAFAQKLGATVKFMPAMDAARAAIAKATGQQ